MEKGEESKCDFQEQDLAKVIGSSETGRPEVDNSKEPVACMQNGAVQCLMKGDKLFSIVWSNEDTWTAFIGGQWRKKSCNFVTGEVVVTKDWSASQLFLQTRWENGTTERLKQATCAELAYGDRVRLPWTDHYYSLSYSQQSEKVNLQMELENPPQIFVLDRQIISPGSRVCLIGQPTVEGSVLAKRYLATASTTSTKHAEYVFEDLDLTKLRRENHGPGYKDNKILYRGWFGITTGYRTRIYMQSQVEDDSFFTLVVDGSVSNNLNVGDDITLSFKILRGAEFSGGATGSSNWLVNFFRYYNTTATVVDFEIDQLSVCWIGRATTPTVIPTEYELENGPDEIILHEELCHVQYLFGEPQFQMAPQTLWVYQCSSADYPISKEQWTKKWLKNLDWDRWEYSNSDEFNQVYNFGSKHVTLQILFVRAVVDILWNNGEISTMNCGDLIPIKLGSLWSDMVRLQTGSVVRTLSQLRDRGEYGIIIGFSGQNLATVKWITLDGAISSHDDNNNIRVSTESLYDLAEIPEYDYLKSTNQYPLVNCGKTGKIGVVMGWRQEDFKIRVRLVNEPEEYYWPHEMKHYQCDVFICPVENRWTQWYGHLVPPSGVIQVSPELNSTCNTKEFKMSKRFEIVQHVPRDNVFSKEEIRPRTRETSYHQAMEEELAELEKNLPAGMWVQYYEDRGDIFSAVLVGPKESIFEDFLFVFDIFIMEDFPRSEPYLNFRSMGLTVLPGHLCKSGALFLPEESRLLEEDLSCSNILNILLEIRDFLGIPLEKIHEKNKISTLGMQQEDDTEELYKLVILATIDYAVAILRDPPANWGGVISDHFTEALPRISERFARGTIKINRDVAILSTDEGGVLQTEGSKAYIEICDEGFLESVASRISVLEKLCGSF